MSEYEPEYVPFTGPPVPTKEKKKEKPKKEIKEKKEKKPPKKEKPKKEKKERKPSKKAKIVSPEEIKIYTWQMERFQIMLADSKNILVALMLDSAPSDPIKEALLKFAKSFEGKYGTEIETFRGNVSWFKPAAEIADDSFNMFLMRPQCLPMLTEDLKKISLTETETKIIRVAKYISEKTGYFFLATLLDEVLKRFKYPQERVLKAFFNLHRKKAFIPIHIEDVGTEVVKRQLWQQVCCIDAISPEECDLLMDDLIIANEESRIDLIAKVLSFNKKTRKIQLREEIVRRKQIRKERDEYFKQVEELLKLNDYNGVVQAFQKIIKLSMELGEASVAQELIRRSQTYREEVNQMAQRIPALRSQRNEALNQAELLELSGNYEGAAKQFDIASRLSTEIGEMDKAKEYLDQTQRMMNLAELARLRERLK